MQAKNTLIPLLVSSSCMHDTNHLVLQSILIPSRYSTREWSAEHDGRAVDA